MVFTFKLRLQLQLQLKDVIVFTHFVNREMLEG